MRKFNKFKFCLSLFLAFYMSSNASCSKPVPYLDESILDDTMLVMTGQKTAEGKPYIKIKRVKEKNFPYGYLIEMKLKPLKIRDFHDANNNRRPRSGSIYLHDNASLLGMPNNCIFVVLDKDYDLNGDEIGTIISQNIAYRANKRLNYGMKSAACGDYLGAFNMLKYLLERQGAEFFAQLSAKNKVLANFLCASSALMIGRYEISRIIFQNLFFGDISSDDIENTLSSIDKSLAKFYYAEALCYTGHFPEVISMINGWFSGDCEELQHLYPPHQILSAFFVARSFRGLGDFDAAILRFQKLFAVIAKYGKTIGEIGLLRSKYHYAMTLFEKDEIEKPSPEELRALEKKEKEKTKKKLKKGAVEQGIATIEQPIQDDSAQSKILTRHGNEIADIMYTLFAPKNAKRLSVELTSYELACAQCCAAVAFGNRGQIDRVEEMLNILFTKDGCPSQAIINFGECGFSKNDGINLFGEKPTFVSHILQYFFSHPLIHKYIIKFPLVQEMEAWHDHSTICDFVLNQPFSLVMLLSVRLLFNADGSSKDELMNNTSIDYQAMLRNEYANATFDIGNYQEAFMLTSYFLDKKYDDFLDVLEILDEPMMRYIYAVSAYKIHDKESSGKMAMTFFSNDKWKALFNQLSKEKKDALLLICAEKLFDEKKYEESLQLFKLLFKKANTVVYEFGGMTFKDYQKGFLDYSKIKCLDTRVKLDGSTSPDNSNEASSSSSSSKSQKSSPQPKPKKKKKH